MKPVKSSNVSEIGYDESTKTMDVRFKKTNALYRYTQVPKTVYDEFISAESIGKFLHKNIVGNKSYPFTKVE